jgi:hypothetical protein
VLHHTNWYIPDSLAIPEYYSALLVRQSTSCSHQIRKLKLRTA